MQLCETTTPRGKRYYVDRKRVSRALVVALKGDHTQDSFFVRIRDFGTPKEEVRHYSVLRSA